MAVTDRRFSIDRGANPGSKFTGRSARTDAIQKSLTPTFEARGGERAALTKDHPRLSAPGQMPWLRRAAVEAPPEQRDLSPRAVARTAAAGRLAARRARERDHAMGTVSLDDIDPNHWPSSSSSSSSSFSSSSSTGDALVNTIAEQGVYATSSPSRASSSSHQRPRRRTPGSAARGNSSAAAGLAAANISLDEQPQAHTAESAGQSARSKSILSRSILSRSILSRPSTPPTTGQRKRTERPPSAARTSDARTAGGTAGSANGGKGTADGIVNESATVDEVCGWGVYCCDFLLLPSYCFLLLPVSPARVQTPHTHAAVNVRRLLPSPTVSQYLKFYNPSKFTPQPPS